ncbi:hypothetical protein AB0368_02085 [Actinoplanes sp. NPDC051475]|uniref:hypothetical protein n=1 Tax=Actinoplanes sp. NPDC051475 TaxID=3157225 RepID=UPI00345031AF
MRVRVQQVLMRGGIGQNLVHRAVGGREGLLQVPKARKPLRPAASLPGDGKAHPRQRIG